MDSDKHTGAPGLSGRLVVVARAGEHHVASSHAASLHETSAAIVRRAGEIIAVRIADDHAHNVAADLTDDGEILLTVSGPPSFGEMGAIRTAQTLIGYLNAKDGTWGTPEDVSPGPKDASADCEARDATGAVLRIQVVRADVTQSLWRALSAAGRLSARYSVDELAELIVKAVESKRLRGSPDIALALDAGILASHAFGVVAEKVQRRLASMDAPYGFAGVWLVGPSSSMVWQLA